MRGFHCRFYPSPEQKTALAKTFGCARYVYNWALNWRSTAWKERQERINYGQTSEALSAFAFVNLIWPLVGICLTQVAPICSMREWQRNIPET